MLHGLLILTCNFVEPFYKLQFTIHWKGNRTPRRYQGCWLTRYFRKLPERA